MLVQYRLTLAGDRPCHPQPEWGYRLYAALLEAAPDAFGAGVHGGGVTPVSQYVTARGGALCWHVTLLGRNCRDCLEPVLRERDAFFLENGGVRLQVTEREARGVDRVTELLEWAEGCSGRHRLTLRTAAAFKSRGQYRNLPTTRLIVQSLMKKWNGCFPDFPIEDQDGQGMEALAEGLAFGSFSLRDGVFRLKGHSLPGFVGTLVVENRMRGFHRLLADALLCFSGYAGIGIKTALGMGGVEHETLP